MAGRRPWKNETGTAESPTIGPEEARVRSIEVEILMKTGLHARPAANFVRAAGAFASTIRIENLTGKRPPANAKSITSVLAAGAESGHIVKITADGPDEEQAVETLAELLAGLDEPVSE